MPEAVRGDVFWIEFQRITPPENEVIYDRRPVLVMYTAGVNVIVGMITTKDYRDSGAVQISPDDYVFGGTREIHYFRPDRITTDHRDWLLDRVGRLKQVKLKECLGAVQSLLSL